jgi:hypothetical protein
MQHRVTRAPAFEVTVSEAIPGAVSTAGQREQALRVKAWIAEVRGLAPTVPIMAVEVRCNLPDCPPVETMTAIIVDRRTERVKLQKPLLELCRDDIVAAWSPPA